MKGSHEHEAGRRGVSLQVCAIPYLQLITAHPLRKNN